MAVKTRYVIRLIEELAETMGQSLDYYGFGRISEQIPDDGISQRYIDDLYRNMCGRYAQGHQNSRPSQHYLDILSRKLGYSNFTSYARACEQPLSDTLLACTGTWWSMAMAHSGDYILKAPVRIYQEKQKVRMELKGQERVFSGDLDFEAGNVFVYMLSGSEKRLSLVMKTGFTRKLNIIHGVFCGVSTMGDPISGKELLMREEHLSYDDMKWERIQVGDNRLDRRLQQYFTGNSDNTIRIGRVISFSIEELRA